MQIKMPNGDMVEFPDDMPKDQIQSMIQKKFPDAGGTRGGDLARGLLHGATMGQVGEAPPENASGWRKAGEEIGDVGTSFATGLIPGGMVAKGVIGAGLGAARPANSWTERAENAAIGGGSALTGGLIGKIPVGVRTALDRIAEMGIGSAVGYSHLGPWGGMGGLWAGKEIGRQIEHMTGGRGLADIVAAIANNPGLASYIGYKASPAIKQAGEYGRQELGKPSQ
jgi:hypothetical protein